jgi:hypothetical protein
MVNGMRPSDMKREMNEQFRLNHPELRAEMTLSKIRAIKLHLLEIGKQLDLEISSVAHAFVYFEKLVIKVSQSEYTSSLITSRVECGNKKESKVDCSLLLIFSQ